jgi:hypothetical protein
MIRGCTQCGYAVHFAPTNPINPYLLSGSITVVDLGAGGALARAVQRGSFRGQGLPQPLGFVASSTHVPVPEVFGVCEKDGFRDIFMSGVIGTPLHDVFFQHLPAANIPTYYVGIRPFLITYKIL